jgi:lipopolysaccharide export LptBFGC system permease protein LptF
MQRKYKLVMIVVISLFLIGGASIAIIKEVEHLRIEKKKRQKAESIKESKKEVKEQAKARQKIALWVVQHYEGAEPIKTIEVGKIYTYGILGSGGRSTSVIINKKKQNAIEGIVVDEDNNPMRSGSYYANSEYKYVEEKMTDKNLEGVDVIYWEGKHNDTRFE